MSLVSTDLNQATPEKANMASATKSDKLNVAELKNGKIVFRQKPISLESHSDTMKEIVGFRALLEASQDPIQAIPDEHLSLIAKLVHESDKTLNTLIKSVLSSLVPPTLELSQDSKTVEAPCRLSPSAVEHAIKAVADRINYGIVTDSDKSPAALCVWRWEVRNPEWLPKSTTEKAEARLQERVAAKKYLQTTFDDLSTEEKDAIVKSVKPSKAKGKEPAVESGQVEKQVSQSPVPEQGGEDPESSTKKAVRPKKQSDPETLAKEKEKQEKKAVKAEKEKKAAEATKRSAAVFANFFKPTTQSSKHSKGLDSEVAQASSSHSTASPTPGYGNEFRATFKPFVPKKGSKLAPINWFVTDRLKKELQPRYGKDGVFDMGTVIIIDDEDGGERGGEKCRTPPDVDVSALSPKELLRAYVDSKPPSLPPATRGFAVGANSKSESPWRVREIMNQLNEAEVQGDHRAVRRLTAILKNRRKIPAKVFVFAENNRPGYLGTWTRSSSTVGPRTPFARDLLSFDYDHDSDAEWEEEEEGGEDVDSQDESMEDDVSSVGSDLDDWLVDGDEIEVDPTPPLQEPELLGSNTTKRKAANSHEPPNKKRKVVPLIPFQKGPLWEKEMGHCEYEPFRPMCIQLLNDTPFPIDPFTFVSEPIVFDKKKEPEGVFVLPALPGHLLPTQPGVGEQVADDGRGIKRKSQNAQPPPKTVFPEAHIPLLLRKIYESNTSSFVVLVDLMFQEVKALGVKKNALEVKLREVAEKDKTKKSWVVTDDAWTRHGLVKPT